MAPENRGPLAGLRVVELARILAGPWTGQTLADLGADVVKVESPEGDETRRWGPPFITGVDGERLDAAYFHCCNRGKRSVVADLRLQADREMVLRLVDRADILIENFKVGALEKFGLDFESLRARNPRLIYCSITGFGQDGPYSGRPGYDATVQAMSGLMDLTGEAHGGPQKTGVALADILTGIYGAVGILAAVAGRERTGNGQHVDMSLLDVSVGVLANQALNYFVSGTSPRRLGNAHPNLAPWQTFQTRSGFVMLAVGSDAQFLKLCEVLGRAQLGHDARFKANSDRVGNRAELVELLTREIANFTRDDLLQKLEAAGVPAGPINTLEEAFKDPQVIAREMRIDLDAPNVAGGSLPGLRTPIRLSEESLVSSRRAPELGEHTQEIVAELGLSPS